LATATESVLWVDFLAAKPFVMPVERNKTATKYFSIDDIGLIYKQ
jgi:hypothetical protein